MHTKNVILWLKNAQQHCIVVVSLGCNPNMYHKCVSVVHFELQIQVSIRGIFGFPNMWGGNRKANEGKVNSIHDTSIGNYLTHCIPFFAWCTSKVSNISLLPFFLSPTTSSLDHHHSPPLSSVCASPPHHHLDLHTHIFFVNAATREILWVKCANMSVRRGKKVMWGKCTSSMGSNTNSIVYYKLWRRKGRMRRFTMNCVIHNIHVTVECILSYCGLCNP